MAESEEIREMVVELILGDKLYHSLDSLDLPLTDKKGRLIDNRAGDESKPTDHFIQMALR